MLPPGPEARGPEGSGGPVVRPPLLPSRQSFYHTLIPRLHFAGYAAGRIFGCARILFTKERDKVVRSHFLFHPVAASHAENSSFAGVPGAFFSAHGARACFRASLLIVFKGEGGNLTQPEPIFRLLGYSPIGTARFGKKPGPGQRSKTFGIFCRASSPVWIALRLQPGQ